MKKPDFVYSVNEVTMGRFNSVHMKAARRLAWKRIKKRLKKFSQVDRMIFNSQTPFTWKVVTGQEFDRNKFCFNY